MTFNPILKKWSVSNDKSVNYISKFKKFSFYRHRSME